MAKDSYSLITLFKLLYSQKTTKINFNYPTLIIFNAIFLFVIALLSGFKAIIARESFIFNVTSVFIALPLLIIGIYGVIYLFLSAFEAHKKSFFHSLLLFSAYITPVIAIGHVFNLFQATTYNTLITNSIGVIIGILFIYLAIISIKNIKTYFSTTYYRTCASILLTIMCFLLISLIYYVIFLIQNIQNSIR